MSRVLVTGASGFVAQSLIPRLLREGHDVLALVRKPAAWSCGFKGSLDVMQGDIRDPDAINLAVRGVDEIYHLAAATTSKSLKQSRAVNVGGVKNLIAAIRGPQSPPKLVFVSSLAVSGPTTERGVTERDVCRPVSHYGITKYEAEQSLREVAAEIPITIVRPPCVFGPWDRNLLLLFQSVKRGLNVCAGSSAYLYSFLHVEDLAWGLLAAMQRGATVQNAEDQINQGIYYLTDPRPMSFKAMADLAGTWMGRESVRTIVLPISLCWLIACGTELQGRMTGRLPFLNFDKIREARAGSWICHTDRAEEDLDFEPQASLEERLRETFEWYLREGWLTCARKQSE